MTSVAFEFTDIYYQAVHHKTGHVWMSPSGKTKFRRPSDLKSAWRHAVKKGNNGRICTLGNAQDVPPKRIMKAINPRAKRPVWYLFPKFDEQNVYKIVEVKSNTLLQLERAKELLRLSAGHVTFDVKEQIVKFLSEGI